jgi:hypothetical protein
MNHLRELRQTLKTLRISKHQQKSENYKSAQCRLCMKIACFYVVTIQRIYLLSDDFYSDSTLILTTLAVKECMVIGARLHVCRVYFDILMFVLTLADGLCCAWCIYPVLCWCWCPELGTSSIDWAQLSRFHLKTEIESCLRNVF